jgi:hypothetical protein
MGLFDKYQVIEKGSVFSADKVVLDNVSQSEAQKFIDSKSGFLGDGNDYFIQPK